MMKKRIFIAIHVLDRIKKEILSWQNKHSFLNVRWVGLKNIHITLVPPWYTDEEGVKETARILEDEIVNFRSFLVDFRQVNYGPAKNRPKLIWAEGYTPKVFENFKESVEDALLLNKDAGFRKKEKRASKFHLTIARFNFLKSLAPLDDLVNWSFRAERVEILESKLKKTGADYSVLRSFTFGK